MLDPKTPLSLAIEAEKEKKVEKVEEIEVVLEEFGDLD